MAISAAKLMVEVGADTSQAEAGLKGLGKSIQGAAKTGAVAGGILTAAITAPLIGIAADSIMMAATYEQSMNILQSVTSATEADMASMSDMALQLGADTIFSANEAAAAMLELGKAGMTTTEIMGSIEGVMDLAAAGQIALDNAAGITVSTLNAFNMGMDESGRVADVLTAAANASLTSVEGLGMGVANAGFAFNMMGWSVEDLAASMAILTNNGLTASDSSTALKNAALLMQNPTMEAREEMDKLGISFYDLQGNTKGLPDILENITLATAGMTEQQRANALGTIFTGDALKALIPLLNAEKEGYVAMVEEVSKSGAAAAAADAANSGLSGGLEKLKGSIDSLRLGAALPFLDTLGQMATKAGEAVDWFGALSPEIVTMGLSFLGMAALAGPALLILSGIAGAITALGTTVGLTILSVLGVALAVAFMAYAWTTNMGDIQGKTEEVMAVVQPLLDAAATSLGTLATAIGTAFTNFSNLIGLSWEEADIPTFEELFKDLLSGDFSGLAGKLQAALDSLILNLKVNFKLIDQGSESQPPMKDTGAKWENLGAVPERYAKAMNDAMLAHPWEADGYATGQTIGFSIAAGINSGITAWNWASEMDKKFRVDSKGFKLDVFIGDIISEIQSGFKPQGFEAQKNQIVANAITSWNTFMGNLTQGLVDAFDVTGINKALEQFDKDNAKDLTNIGKSFTDSWATVTASITTFRTNIETDVGTLSSAFGTAWSTLTAAFTTLKTNVSTMFTGLGDTISAAITTMIDAIKATLGLGAATEEPTTPPRIGNAEGPQSPTSAIMQSLTTASIAIDAFAASMGGTLLTNLTSLATQAGLAKDSIMNAFTGLQTAFNLGVALLFGTATIPKFEWPKIDTPPWATWFGGFAWSTFIPEALSWSTFIPNKVAWRTYVPFDLNWETWVDKLDWGQYVSGIVGWLQGALGFGGGGGSSAPTPAQASGTPYFKGGMSWVGERGPELVRLPRGSAIYSNGNSMAMAGSGITVNVNVASVASDIDIEALAYRISRVIQRKTS